MAAISIVRKMAMGKKCGRASQRTAWASGPGWGGSGAAERGRVANLHDERNEAAGMPGVGLVLRVGGTQDPLLKVGAHHLGSEEDRKEDDMEAKDGGEHQSKAGDDLAEVDGV